ARRLLTNLTHARHHPLPMRKLLWEEPQVAEARKPAQHGGARDLHRPTLGHRLQGAPATLLLIVLSGENGVRLVPFASVEARGPERLRLRPVNDNFAEALELTARAAVEERVVGKAGGLDE